MQWEKVTWFGGVHYVSGIYKLSSYTYDRGGYVDRYWQAYYIPERFENWGNFVEPENQHNKRPTLAEAKAMCKRHAAEYVPSKRQLRVAERSVANIRANP